MLNKKKNGLLQREPWIKYSWLALLFSAVFMLYPIFYSMYLSVHSFKGLNVKFNGLGNFARLFQDTIFWKSMGNVFIYLIFQVPIMLFLGLIFAYLLNENIKFKGFFRMVLFLPCVTSLVSYAIIFRMLFQVDGLVNQALIAINIIDNPIHWLTDSFWAKITIIIALCWRWTGYNMMFYISGLQNVSSSTLEAARIDGANKLQEFLYVVIPQLKPVIVFTSITSTIGTIRLFDEVVNLTEGGPSNATMTVIQYIYNHSFVYSSNFGYSAAMSWVVVIIIAILSFIQLIATREKEV